MSTSTSPASALGHRVQVAARGHVIATRSKHGAREVLVHLVSDRKHCTDVWLLADMVVLLQRADS